MVTSNVRHDTMLDFRAIDPASIGDGTAVKLPTGVYEAFISEAKIVTSKQGKPQTEFKCKIKDPKYGGTVRTVWIGHSQRHILHGHTSIHSRLLNPRESLRLCQIKSGHQDPLSSIDNLARLKSFVKICYFICK